MNIEQVSDSYMAIDIALADFFAGDIKSDQQKSLLETTIKELSQKMRSGHTGIPVSDAVRIAFQETGLASDGSQIKPFVVEDSSLYLYRYWKYESIIAESVRNLSRVAPQALSNIESILTQLFPVETLDTSIEGIDWQKYAVEQSLNQNFSMITGGPGTGKTTTVIKLLSALISIKKLDVKISLAAPTGKAASRLQESINSGKTKLQQLLGDTTDYIPDHVYTIHKLLGPKYLSPYFKYDQTRKLPFDVVVIDEASMIDVPLMAKFLQALKPNARLILLGDIHQLASVEVGSVLADLSGALPDQTFFLKKTYRFSGAIKALATHVNKQNYPQVLTVLANNGDEVELIAHGQSALKFLLSKTIEYIANIKNSHDIATIFKHFNAFQILCSNNFGDYGLEGINHFIEHGLENKNVISKSGGWYVGKPIMISENVSHSSMRLNNGDIGICLPDAEGKLFVYFESDSLGYKKYSPSKLPKYQVAYAMSIHKSQGSEFDHVVIALPETSNPILTKELLYTGITRAKKHVTMIANRSILQEMIAQKVSRNGGLARKIKNTV